MAKILPLYSLCPLIEEKSFVGISEDKDNDKAIITINGNIVSRYSITNPKQLHSWNTKGNITYPVIYNDQDEQYIGIFNDNEIRLWTNTTENIEKVKKYKFVSKLKGLLKSQDGRIYVLFNDGNIKHIDNAINDRKDKLTPILKDAIIHFKLITYLNENWLLLLTDKNDIYVRNVEITNYHKYSVSRPDLELVTYCFVSNDLISLWSDGKLYKFQLLPKCDSSSLIYITTLNEYDVNKRISTCAMTSSYIVLYGNDKEDGQNMITLYNLKYNIIQCKYKYKSTKNEYSPLWYMACNKLLLIMGQNLVVVPILLENQKLTSLIGCNNNELKNDNLPEYKLYEQIIPELIENKMEEEILKILKNLPDISDSILIDILGFSCINRYLDIVKIIITSYSVINDVMKFKNVITFELSLILLNEIINCFYDNDLNSCEKINIIKWSSLILDASYQKYLLANDKLVYEKLITLKQIVNKEFDVINDYKMISIWKRNFNVMKKSKLNN